MFFCEECRKARDYPESMVKSYGECELCGKIGSCYDVPSKFLTPKKEVDLYGDTL